MLLWEGIYHNSTTLMYREKTSKIEMWSLKYDCASNGAKSIMTRHQHHGQSELRGQQVPPQSWWGRNVPTTSRTTCHHTPKAGWAQSLKFQRYMFSASS